MKPVPLLAATLICLAPAGARAGDSPLPLDQCPTRHGYQRIAGKWGVVAYQDKAAGTIDLIGEGIFASPVDQVLATLLDYPSHPGRVARLAESRILRRGQGWLLVYQRLDLPLVDDRDFTLRVDWQPQGSGWRVCFRVARGHGPGPRRGVVRVSHHQGCWQLKPVRGGAGTLARLQVSSDMAGRLPAWLAKGNAAKDIPDLYAALRRLASQGAPRARR